MSFEQVLFKNIEDSIRAKRDYLQRPESHEALIGAIDAVIACYRTGGRLYIAGNGGSAADAQHLATEFVSKLARDRNPLPAEALTTGYNDYLKGKAEADTAHLTLVDVNALMARLTKGEISGLTATFPLLVGGRRVSGTRRQEAGDAGHRGALQEPTPVHELQVLRHLCAAVSLVSHCRLL